MTRTKYVIAAQIFLQMDLFVQLKLYIFRFLSISGVDANKAIAIVLLVISILYTVVVFKRRKRIPPYNKENMFETFKLFTGTKSPEYMLNCCRTVGNVFTCKFNIMLPSLSFYFFI